MAVRCYLTCLVFECYEQYKVVFLLSLAYTLGQSCSGNVYYTHNGLIGYRTFHRTITGCTSNIGIESKERRRNGSQHIGHAQML